MELKYRLEYGIPDMEPARMLSKREDVCVLAVTDMPCDYHVTVNNFWFYLPGKVLDRWVEMGDSELESSFLKRTGKTLESFSKSTIEGFREALLEASEVMSGREGYL